MNLLLIIARYALLTVGSISLLLFLLSLFEKITLKREARQLLGVIGAITFCAGFFAFTWSSMLSGVLVGLLAIGLFGNSSGSRRIIRHYPKNEKETPEDPS